MDVNDFKLYSAKVGQGSGVLFQPMNKRDYTYILTANHNLFEEKDNDRGIKEKNLLNSIDIFIPKHFVTEPIEIDLLIMKLIFLIKKLILQ